MADTITFRVDGLRELGNALKALGDPILKKISGQATGAMARKARDTAKQTLKQASIDTGLVEKNVIAKKLSRSQTSLTSAHIVTVKKVRYPTDNKSGKRNTRKTASQLEHGNINMAAEPFLAPSVRNHIPELSNLAKKRLQAGLEREVKRIGKK